MHFRIHRTPALAAGVVILTALASAAARATGVLPVIERPATRVVAPERSVLLAVTTAGARLVSVGERGVVATSDDNGATWQQRDVPASVTLTSVAFVDANHGWCAGHSGVVLHSDDGGTTWERQFDGKRAAAQAQRDAAARPGAAGAAYRKLAGELVADGPDAPFLAILARDPSHVMIAGANGLLFATADGGAHWVPRMAGIANRRGLHYYALAAHGRWIFVAGEAGTFARSSDGGRTFTALRTPYAGSFFGASVTSAGMLVLTGFHGTILTSRDDGKHFARVGSPISTSINGATVLPDASVAMVTQAGMLADLSSAGRLKLLPSPPLALPAAIARAADGTFVIVGFSGATRLPASAAR